MEDLGFEPCHVQSDDVRSCLSRGSLVSMYLEDSLPQTHNIWKRNNELCRDHRVVDVCTSWRTAKRRIRHFSRQLLFPSTPMSKHILPHALAVSLRSRGSRESASCSLPTALKDANYSDFRSCPHVRVRLSTHCFGRIVSSSEPDIVPSTFE